MSAIRYEGRYRFSNSGIKIGIDFQTLVSSWHIDGSNFPLKQGAKVIRILELQWHPPPLP